MRSEAHFAQSYLRSQKRPDHATQPTWSTIEYYNLENWRENLTADSRDMSLATLVRQHFRPSTVLEISTFFYSRAINVCHILTLDASYFAGKLLQYVKVQDTSPGANQTFFRHKLCQKMNLKGMQTNMICCFFQFLLGKHDKTSL